MKWITREKVKVDRVSCPWLIKRFIDPEAEFLFLPVEQALETAQREAAVPFDVAGVELGHHEGRCSFEAILQKDQVKDPILYLLAQIVHDADVSEDFYGRLEAPGLKAIALGFSYLGLRQVCWTRLSRRGFPEGAEQNSSPAGWYCFQ